MNYHLLYSIRFTIAQFFLYEYIQFLQKLEGSGKQRNKI